MDIFCTFIFPKKKKREWEAKDYKNRKLKTNLNFK